MDLANYAWTKHVGYAPSVALPISLQYVRKRKTFFAHDENEQCQVGDLVKIKECRPISRKKHFTVVEIVEHGPSHATLSCGTHTQEPTCTSETPHKPTPTQGLNHTAPSSGTHTQAPT